MSNVMLAPARHRRGRFALAVCVAIGAAVAIVGGCSFSLSDAPSEPLSPIDAGDGTVIDLETETGLNDSASAGNKLCGSITACNPDEPAFCVSMPIDAGPAPETDAQPDTGKLACRVVHSTREPKAACAPAGNAGESAYCDSD